MCRLSELAAPSSAGAAAATQASSFGQLSNVGWARVAFSLITHAIKAWRSSLVYSECAAAFITCRYQASGAASIAIRLMFFPYLFDHFLEASGAVAFSTTRTAPRAALVVNAA